MNINTITDNINTITDNINTMNINTITDNINTMNFNTDNDIVWLSIDPVKCKIDYYPKDIAIKIENAYCQRDSNILSNCALGSDFFNATVHFDTSGICYQTTIAIDMGKAGYKHPGYRSVKRVIITPENIDKTVTIYAKFKNNECQLSRYQEDIDIIFTEKVPDRVVITPTFNK